MNFQQAHQRLNDPDPDARIAVLRELSGSKEEAALPFVYGALEDPDLSVRHAANEALIAMRRGVGILTAIDRAGSSSADERLSATTLLEEHPDRRALDRLTHIACEARERPDVRARAIGAFVGIADPDSVDILLDLLDDEEREVRSAAIRAIAQMPFEVEPGPHGTVEAVTRIAAFLNSQTDDDETHAQAALALGTCDWPSALNYLAEAVEDRRAAVRESALHAVANRKDAKKHDGCRKAIQRLLSAEKDPSLRSVVMNTASILGLDPA